MVNLGPLIMKPSFKFASPSNTLKIICFRSSLASESKYAGNLAHSESLAEAFHGFCPNTLSRGSYSTKHSLATSRISAHVILEVS